MKTLITGVGIFLLSFFAFTPSTPRIKEIHIIHKPIVIHDSSNIIIESKMHTVEENKRQMREIIKELNIK